MGLFRRKKADTATASGPAAGDESASQEEQKQETGQAPAAGDAPAVAVEEPAPAAAPATAASAPGPAQAPAGGEALEAQSIALFRRLAADHGAEFAARAVEQGWGYPQALEARIGELKGELKAARDRFEAHVQANGGRGAEAAASYQERPDAAARERSGREKELAGSIGPRLARVAASMKLAESSRN